MRFKNISILSILLAVAFNFSGMAASSLGVKDLTATGTVSGVTVSGTTVVATKFIGDGSLLTDLDIALTGDVTGSGTSPVATTIANAAVSLAKMANMDTASLIYRRTAGAGAPEVNTLATLKIDLALTQNDISGLTNTQGPTFDHLHLTNDLTAGGTVSGVTISGTTVMGTHTGDGSLLEGIDPGPTSGTSILKGDDAGGFDNAVAGTDYLEPDGSGASLTDVAPVNSKYLVLTPDANLSDEIDLSALLSGPNAWGLFGIYVISGNYGILSKELTSAPNGLLKLTNDFPSNIDISTAVPGTDYLEPDGSGVSLTDVTPIAHKTVEDAINGLVGVDGFGNYTAYSVSGTTTTPGLLELATDAETITGTDTARAVTPAGLQAKMDVPTLTVSGTTVTITAPLEYYVCTAITTVTAATPTAGFELCVQNGNNVSSVITIEMPADVMIENQARTAYSTAGTGHGIRSNGAVGDQIHIVAIDSTHYHIWQAIGTWTVY